MANHLKNTFTIHFATINTFTVIAKISSISLFTIHFATINTDILFGEDNFKGLFTIHFATINTVTHFTQCL